MKIFQRRAGHGWVFGIGRAAVSDPLHPIGAGGHGVGKMAEQFYAEAHRIGVLSGKPAGGAAVYAVLFIQHFTVFFEIFLKKCCFSQKNCLTDGQNDGNISSVLSTSYADVAQLAEQLTCNQQVIGSSPIIGFFLMWVDSRAAKGGRL